jgi:hypothetical protein
MMVLMHAQQRTSSRDGQLHGNAPATTASATALQYLMAYGAYRPVYRVVKMLAERPTKDFRMPARKAP